MLYALRHPAVLLGLAIGFWLSCQLRVVAARLITSRRSGLRIVASSHSPLRGVTSPRAWLDPFGAVGVVLAGVGWSPRQELVRQTTGRLIALVVSAVAVNAVLAAAAVALFDHTGGSNLDLNATSTASALHGDVLPFLSVGQQITLGVIVEAIGCGLLALAPVPPLELGVLIWSIAPKSAGARRIAYHVLEEQWGVAIVLVLLLLPLGGSEPPLLSLIGTIGDRILASL